MLKLPVIVAPMFLVSNPQMVIESGRAGVIGTFPLLNARPASVCAEWLKEVKDELGDTPWGVNFICHKKSNMRYDEDLGLIREYEPPIVITSLGHPGEVVDVVHAYGGTVYSDVAHVKHARKAAQTGVDGLILVCSGAGGHGGTLNPFAFISAVKTFYEGKIILSGALSSGADVAAALAMGADYAYLGTRFLAAKESGAFEDYKQMVIDSTIEDIVYTDAISGVPANFLAPSLVRQGLDPDNLKAPGKLNFSGEDEVKAWRDAWSAGQGVTNVTGMETVAEIVGTLIREYDETIARLSGDRSGVAH
ncbi:NAD(P)H-dependent flavin oxidoreductase [Edaphobacillus lindanitolerans]|uniref:Probable nitronate monooxygenase n=1 Tax=Edaphobacillus lindanitolerans TaxID=550447 RepID=A0A1U7PJ05_9BACI|nr:nitronate monooxygenase [Edaphobacillus lindanitolerans]SIT79831.1 nitronate monooxygenase [Edaphobacillus lindanitolerans]